MTPFSKKNLKIKLNFDHAIASWKKLCAGDEKKVGHDSQCIL